MRSFYPPKNVESATRRILRTARAIEPRYRYVQGGEPQYGRILPAGRYKLEKEMIRSMIGDQMIQGILLKRTETLIRQLRLNQQGIEFVAINSYQTAKRVADYTVGKFCGNREEALACLIELETELSSCNARFPSDKVREFEIVAARKRLTENQRHQYAANLTHTINNLQYCMLVGPIKEAQSIIINRAAENAQNK